jgi:hypothetical protein
MNEASTPPPNAPMRTGAILVGVIACVVFVSTFYAHGEWVLTLGAIGGGIILAYFGFKVQLLWLRILCWIAALLLAAAVCGFFWGITHMAS